MFKFQLPNGKEICLPPSTIQEFITVTLVDNPQWEFSQLLTKEEVHRWFNRTASESDVKKIKRYILIFAENIVFSSYLFAVSQQGFEGMANSSADLKRIQLESLQILREMIKKPDSYENVDLIINFCLQCGIDPF